MKELAAQVERLTRPPIPTPNRKQQEDKGPSRPKVERPTIPNELLRRMKQIDPDRAKRYRQRSGE